MHFSLAFKQCYVFCLHVQNEMQYYLGSQNKTKKCGYVYVWHGVYFREECYCYA